MSRRHRITATLATLAAATTLSLAAAGTASAQDDERFATDGANFHELFTGTDPDGEDHFSELIPSEELGVFVPNDDIEEVQEAMEDPAEGDDDWQDDDDEDEVGPWAIYGGWED